MNFISKDKIEWKRVNYLRQGWSNNYDYSLWINEPLASWDVYPYWERERIESMRQHLKKGDVLFDIGTESGWCNLVYATMVGPENMVLIEPEPLFWPNIQALWEKNYPGISPLACFSGLISDKTTAENVLEIHAWPAEASGDLIDRNSYKYIHEHGDQIQQITIDEYIKRTGIIPDALTMDTEGSEMLILKGAEDTLKTHHPKLWVSIHPDLALKDYGIQDGEVVKYLESLGYNGTYLATDHEEHWFFI